MISIIIPAYNAEKTIGRCLESIVNQTYRNFHIIVVDDGSIDSTLAIANSDISRLRNREISLKVVTQKNQGAQAARNRGYAEIVRGLTPHNYVLFCDADIVLRPDCLEKMISALEAHTEASYAYSSFKFGWKIFKLWPFDAERLRQMPYIHTTSLIRAECFPGWDESIKRLQDWDLWLTMLGQGHIGVWVPEILFQVISTQGTMSKWLPSFAYKIPKWLGIQSKAVSRYNQAVARIKEKHNLR